MRVLWLSPGFPADEQDHNCLPPLQLLAGELSSLGIDLQVITLGYPFHSKAYRWHGIPVISGFGFNRKWFRWMNWFRVLQYAMAAHKSQKFEVIHSFWLGPAWLIGVFLQFWWKIPLYTTLMGQDVLANNKYRHLLRNGNRLIAVSRFQQKVFEHNNRIRATYCIPWGVQKAEMPTHFPAHRSIDILGCGAFIPLKNWALWLQVVAEVAKTHPGLQAELIGDGTDKPAIENMIRQLNLEKMVSLPGHLPRTAVLNRMLQAKVLLHTSNFESFGFVLTEAAMCGCRVVSTPVGIAAELKEVATQAENMCAAVQHALDQDLLKSGTVPFSMEETAQRYMQLYQESGNKQ